jgi:hypothetical protein
MMGDGSEHFLRSTVGMMMVVRLKLMQGTVGRKTVEMSCLLGYSGQNVDKKVTIFDGTQWVE